MRYKIAKIVLASMFISLAATAVCFFFEATVLQTIFSVITAANIIAAVILENDIIRIEDRILEKLKDGRKKGRK